MLKHKLKPIEIRNAKMTITTVFHIKLNPRKHDTKVIRPAVGIGVGVLSISW